MGMQEGRGRVTMLCHSIRGRSGSRMDEDVLSALWVRY